VSGENLDIKCQQSFTFGFRGQKFTHAFLVYSLPTEASGLLGMDFMESRNDQLRLMGGKITLNVEKAAPQEYGTPRSKRAVFTVFTQSIAFPNHPPEQAV
jgi:hypothetical protein